ncbi:phosphoribosylanthranilate isomerase [Povalibacter uvarum]|uniref:N-(5'-phosphoribosyl)anthranilate isomerase n=1 Tax=Povalibacter uvarum TaxID=732238 RepID=A0A841HJ24_9GAMM|nr:phosphoribosylanthranilate isomerase [Povalibacter uvarum]MBB6092806.1 phosphoribosylanthranilate isomerase [Povalibacter uvarum]
MKLWIKICGLTSEEGLAAAIEAGADAIGFVFAPSKRQITPQRAVELARGVQIPRVAVMQHPSQELLDEVWEVFRPDVLQTDAEDLRGLIVPDGLNVTPVVRSGRVPDELPRRLLFEGPASGTGTTTDWAEAAGVARRTELILAGGLNAGNVADAIRRVGPFGVDVSSGVERSPGVKDRGRIHQFVRTAREAAESER